MAKKKLIYNEIENKWDKLKNERQEKYRGYNPFKMWGSYVGMVAGLVTLILGSIMDSLAGVKTLFPAVIFFRLLLGFLLGWAIHSLCRYIKNRKIKN